MDFFFRIQILNLHTFWIAVSVPPGWAWEPRLELTGKKRKIAFDM